MCLKYWVTDLQDKGSTLQEDMVENMIRYYKHKLAMQLCSGIIQKFPVVLTLPEIGNYIILMSVTCYIIF